MPESYNSEDIKCIEVAELTTTCNKYHPGKQTFYIPSLNPMNSRPNTVTTLQDTTKNIRNANNTTTSATIECGSNIVLELPREIARSYPKKFIPPGTRFLVSFIGGDLSKPVIIGREYDGYEISDDK